MWRAQVRWVRGRAALGRCLALLHDGDWRTERLILFKRLLSLERVSVLANRPSFAHN